jgi:hypothetical protein
MINVLEKSIKCIGVYLFRLVNSPVREPILWIATERRKCGSDEIQKQNNNLKKNINEVRNSISYRVK